MSRRLNPVSGVALAVSLLAMLVAGAGVGVAAATIGTAQIKNNAITGPKIKKNAVTAKKIKKNAVTSAKVKDGSLSVADLPAQDTLHAATVSNGGEGDCIWTSGDTLIPGIGGPTFRKDVFGNVSLYGVAIGNNGPGGDAQCDNSDPGQFSDSIVYTLPAGYIPFKTMAFALGATSAVIVAGPNGLAATGVSLPPGAVATVTSPGSGTIFDGIEFPAAGSPGLAKVSVSGGARSVDPAKILALLGAK